ncbi:MAG: TPR end-of-group domain-containing protein, partial [Planctomycetota bacterium]
LAGARKARAYEEGRFIPLLASSHYNLACIYSLASIGKDTPIAEPKPVMPEKVVELQAKAVVNLYKALKFGWTDLAHIRKDPDLAPIRGLPEFKALMKEWEEKLAKEKGEKKEGGEKPSDK